ncbi:MAG: hypothetical protein AAF721_25485 [Myxococcota bacterium]
MFVLGLALAGVIAAAPGPTRDVVDAAIVVAQAHAAAGDYAQALSTVREARRLSDHPDLLVVEAQILRLSGDCGSAVGLYAEYIASEPPLEDRRFAESNLRACRQAVLLDEADELRNAGDCSAAAPRYRRFLEGDASDDEREAVRAKLEECEAAAAPPVAPVDPVAPPAQPPPAPSDPPARGDAATRDGVGIALWTGGSLGLVAGAAMFGAAWAQPNRSQRDTPTLDTYLDRQRRARVLSGVGIATMSAGASVLIVAAIRHVLRKRRGAAR